MINKNTLSKKFNKYCANVLRMYNNGRVSMAV